MEIINASLAKRIKPLVVEAMTYISNLMNNPHEYIFEGCWTIPVDFQFSKDNIDIYTNLSVGEYAAFYSWICHWLNSSGWGLSNGSDCGKAFEGSKIFPLHIEN